MDKKTLLEVKDLSVYFNLREGVLKAVDGVSFNVDKNSTVGIVGESGSGKSVTAQAFMRILPDTAEIKTGEINYYKDPDNPIKIHALPDKSPILSNIRGKEISMIFQEPMSAFSPLHTIGHQMIECLMLHTPMTKQEARERSIEMLAKVGISNPDKRVDQYSFELSGGMRQRAMIAIALSTNPSIVIADEPTTSLDVTIQAQILKLMKDMQQEFNMSIIFITHNLGVIAQMADTIQIMYLGKIMESGTAEEIFYEPRHPYTINLLKAIPKIGSNTGGKLEAIPGQIPGPFDVQKGCKFCTRCPSAIKGLCDQRSPEIKKYSETHSVFCWKCLEQEK